MRDQPSFKRLPANFCNGSTGAGAGLEGQSNKSNRLNPVIWSPGIELQIWTNLLLQESLFGHRDAFELCSPTSQSKNNRSWLAVTRALTLLDHLEQLEIWWSTPAFPSVFKFLAFSFQPTGFGSTETVGKLQLPFWRRSEVSCTA